MILLDSDVLIDLLKKEARTVEWLRRLDREGEELGTTSLNVAEILRGAAGSHARLAAATRILEGLTEVPFGPRAARRFGRLLAGLDAAGRPIPVVDGMIAAIALEGGGRIATRNRQHFSRVAGLEILDPA